jgi:hypothetical protein
MKFIKLSRTGVIGEDSLHIQPMMITCLEPYAGDPTSRTYVHVIGGGKWLVSETANEIQKLITEAEKFKMTY